MSEKQNGVQTDVLGAKLRSIAKRTTTHAMHESRRPRKNDTGFVPISDDLQGEEPNDYSFLREYVEFSRVWSPRSPRASHEAVALWVLSAAAAGRVVFHLGSKQRAFLYQFLVAPSALYAKSTAVTIGSDLLVEAQLQRVLIGRATPQSFFDQCVEKVPSDWDKRSEEQKSRTYDKLKNAGQRAWYADEFGAWAESMLREGSVNYLFRELLLKIYDSPEHMEYATISRGEDYVLRPTLSLFAVSTYAHLRKLAAANSPLWRDGLFSRIAWITTADDEEPTDEFMPDGERRFPTSLVRSLQEFDALLGVPSVTVSPVYEKTQTGKEKKVLRHDVSVQRHAEFAVSFSAEFSDALKRYDRELRSVVRVGKIPDDLYSSYGRFASSCARTAVLLASSEHRSECTLRDFRKAVAITERNRQSLHDAYFRLTTGAVENDKAERADAILRFVAAERVVGARDILRKFSRQYPQGLRELEVELETLVRAGDLHVVQLEKKNKKRYAVDAAYLAQL